MAFDNEVLEDNRPNVAEDSFDIEDDEEHRHEVEFDREAGSSIADGKHSAFVSFVFDAFGFASFAEVEAHDEGDTGKSYCEKNLQEDRKEIRKHGVVRLNKKTRVGQRGFCKRLAENRQQESELLTLADWRDYRCERRGLYRVPYTLCRLSRRGRG